jgi:hypothetical protein
MAEYIYKGFKIFYDINPQKTEDDLYQASGYVLCNIDKAAPSPTQKFRTEYPTQQGVKIQIKKIIEEYIDFEWEEFLEMQKEH